MSSSSSENARLRLGIDHAICSLGLALTTHAFHIQIVAPGPFPDLLALVLLALVLAVVRVRRVKRFRGMAT